MHIEYIKILLILLLYRLPEILKNYFLFYKISVIIPIFNSEKYLSLCLTSVINQNLKNIEIICIDDGSTDKSLSILKKFQNLDNRLKIITQRNKGSGIARNKGIRISNGKYISFLDSDDIYPNNSTLELLYNKSSKYKSLICGGGLNEFEYINNTIMLLNPQKKFIFNEEGFINYNTYQYDYGYYRFLYNKRFIKKNNIYFPNYLRYQDPPFFIYLF
jgi:glycosyltransferase involved in cell wall biosynthesis